MARGRRGVYGMLAEFRDPEALLEAARRTREAGYRRIDAYSPFPVEGLDEAVGFEKTRLPFVVLLGGTLGGLGGFFLQYYASVHGYPLRVGGFPLNSWPSFVPITFELTVLGAALAAVLGMLAMNGLPMPHHPLFHEDRFRYASRNRFFLCIKSKDPRFDPEKARRFLETLNADRVMEVEL